jgi:GrpB-like predicted nucleotidyltransferase (UPF0157 family)
MQSVAEDGRVPLPIAVRLERYDASWPVLADEEITRFRANAKSVIRVHHIGSTSIPGLAAKPILDLLPVISDMNALHREQVAIESLGYICHGAFGIEGRCYFTRNDPESGDRIANIHCFAEGDPHVERHLAFRDYLRSSTQLTKEYELVKQRCAALHPDNSHSYSDCKDAWIKAVEAEALAWFEGQT